MPRKDDLFPSHPGTPFYYGDQRLGEEKVKESLGDDAVEAQNIADGAVSLVHFATGLTPVQIVNALPGLPDANYPQGSVVFLTTDNKLYRSTGTSWTAAVPTVDLSGVISTSQLADGVVTTVKLGDAQVTASKIGDGSVTTAKIGDNSVTTSKIGNNTVTQVKMGTGLRVPEVVSVLPTLPDAAYPQGATAFLTTDNKLYRSTGSAWTVAVNTTDLLGTILTSQLADGAVTTVKLGDAQVTTEKVADGQITTAKIGDSQVVTEKIAGGSVTQVKMASGLRVPVVLGSLPTLPDVAYPQGATVVLTTDNKLYRSTGAAWTTAVPTSDLSGTISTSQLADGAVTTVKLGDGQVTTTKVADGQITTAKIADNQVTTSKIADTTITQVKMASGLRVPVVVSSLPGLPDAAYPQGATVVLTSDNKLYRSTGTAWTATVPTGDLSGTIATAQLADGAVTTVKLGDSQVTTAKIADSQITTIKIADSQVTTSKIADGNVTTGKIADGNVTTAKIGDNQVTTAKIAGGSVTQVQMASGLRVPVIVGSLPGLPDSVYPQGAMVVLTSDNRLYRSTGTAWTAEVPTSVLSGTVATSQLADGAVTSVKLGDAQVTTAKMADQAVTTAKLGDTQVTTVKLSDSVITTAKIADDQLTIDKFVSKDLSNMVTSPDFRNGLLGRWWSDIGGNIEVKAQGDAGVPSGAPSDWVAKFYRRCAYDRAWGKDQFAVTGGETYYLECTAATPDSTHTFSVGLHMQKADGTHTWSQAATINPTPSWTTLRGIVTVPTDYVRADFYVLIEAYSDFGNWYFTNCRLRKAVVADMIVAGAIVSDKIASGAVIAGKIAAGTIVAADIASAAITGDRIAASTITASNIAADTITAAQIAAGAIGASELAAGAVVAGKIAAGTIVAADIAAGTITGDRIAISTITAAQIAADTITAAQIAAGAIGASELAAGAVVAGKIAAGTIVAADIAAATITGDRLVGNTITAAQIAADTITAAQIAAGAIGASELAAGAVVAGKIAAGTIVASDIAAGTITGDRISASTLASTNLIVGLRNYLSNPNPLNVLRNAGFEDGHLYWRSGTVVTDASKARSGASYMQITGPAGQYSQTFQVDEINNDVWMEVNPGDVLYYGGWTYRESGDAAIHANVIQLLAADWSTTVGWASTASSYSVGAWEWVTGAYTVPSGCKYIRHFCEISPDGTSTTVARFDDLFLTIQVPGAGIVAGSITATQIASSTITATQIAADTITAGQIAAGAIGASELAAGAVVAGKIAAGTIVAADIASATITGAQIAAGTLTASHLAAGTITANEIAAGTIIAAKLAISQLDAIATNLGTITAGVLQNSGATAGVALSGSIPGGWTRYLNLTGSGGSFLKHDKLDLQNSGLALFSGSIRAPVGSATTWDGSALVPGFAFSGYETTGLELVDHLSGGIYTDRFLNLKVQDEVAVEVGVDNLTSSRRGTLDFPLQPRVRAYQSSSTSLAGTAVSTTPETAMSWGATSYDVGTFYSAGTPTRLTVPAGAAGYYQIVASVRWSRNTNLRFLFAGIRRNGTTYVADQATSNAADNNTTSNYDDGSSIVWEGYCNAGDYFEVLVWYRGTGTRTTITGADGCFFSARRLA